MARRLTSGTAASFGRVSAKFGRGRINLQPVITKTMTAIPRALDLFTDDLGAALGTVLSRRKHPPASRPGRPPHWRSGFLFDNTDVIRRGRKIFVKMPKYGEYLEDGTEKMDKRPFIDPTIIKRIDFWRGRLRSLLRQEMR